MKKLDLEKIIQALPLHYYVIECKSKIIVESNDPNVQIGKTCCYEHIYGFKNACENQNLNIKCVCNEVQKKNQACEIIQKVDSNKGFKAHKVTANPIIDDNKNTSHIIVQYISISEQLKLSGVIEKQNLELKKQNEELRKVNHRIEKSKNEIEGLKDFYENINEAVQDGIIVTDKNDLIYYVNPVMENFSGLSRPEFINKHIISDFEETTKNLLPYFNTAKKSLNAQWYEVEATVPLGKKVYQNGWLIPLVKNGKYNGMICTVRDVTERVQTENLLEKSEEKFKSYIENLPDGLFVIDGKGNYLDVNESAVKISEYKREELLKMNFIDLVPEPHRANAMKHFQQVNTKGNSEAIVLFETKSGKQRICLLNGVKVAENTFIAFTKDITEQKRAEQALRESEEKFKAIFNMSLSMICIADINTASFKVINPAFHHILGYTEEELLSKPFLEYVHPDDKQSTIQVIEEELKAGKQVIHFKNRYRCKDNTYRWIEWNSHPFREKGITYAIGHDITKQKEAETELKESEEKYRNLFENLLDEVHLWKVIRNKNGKIKSWELADVNPSALKAWKKTRKQVIGKTANELFNYDTEKLFMPTVEKIFKTGKPHSWEIYFPPTDQYLSMSSIPYGEYFISTGRDVTEKRQAEKELKKSEEKFRKIYENMEVGVAFVSFDFIIEKANEAYCNMLGYCENELLGKHLKDITAKEVLEENLAKQRKLAKGEIDHYRMEKQFIHKNGYTVYGILDANLIRDEKGKPLYFIGSVLDITERKIAELALRDSEQKLRNITENSTNLFYQHTPDHILTYVSPQVKDILGYTVDEAHMKWTELTTDHPINKEGFEKTVKAIKTGEIQPPYNLELKHKSGKKVWVEVREAPLIEKGKVIGIVGAIVDITERKLAEDALKESEERYRKLFESANVGIDIATSKGEILIANSELARIFGYNSIEEFSKINAFELYEDKAERQNLIDKIKKEGAVKNYQIQMKHKTSKKVWANISAQSLDEKMDKLMFILSDITKEKEAEIALQEQEKKFRTYIESSPIPVFIGNEKGEYHYVNEAASNLLGYSKRELQSMSIPDLQLKENIPHEMNMFQTLEQKGYIKGAESKLLHKNGSIVNVSISAVKLSEKQILAFCTDVTQLKNYEKILKKKNEDYYALNEELQENIERIQQINNELIIAKDKAEESDRLKSAFLANMSHEIRTPLNGILGFSSLLRKKGLSEDMRKRYSQIIESSGNRLLSVVNDVFDISLIQSNQMKIEKITFEVNELLDEIFTFYKAIKKDRVEGIKFKLVKNSENEIKLNNDKYRVHQIFKNLIDNAFKFTKEGEVEFGYLPVKNNEVIFYVKDTGIGIPEGHKDIIFSAFRQVDDSITRDYEGAGLGLSISHGLIERMGGKIWVDSTINMGATFYFSLPLKVAKSKNDKIQKQKNKKSNLLKDKMILVVEDDLVSYEFLKIFLENIGGGGIIQTAYGKDAIKIVQKNKIDLIFMDIRLPDIDGYKVTEEIRKTNKKVKIIAQTAYALQNDRDKSIKAGCDDYITKPIQEEVLLKIIKKYIES